MYIKDSSAAEQFMITLAQMQHAAPSPTHNVNGEIVRLDTNQPKDYLPSAYASLLPKAVSCYQPMKDGSYIEGIYFAYKKPTKEAVAAAADTKNLGVSLSLFRGKLIAVKPTDYGCQVQHTHELRKGSGILPHLAFRSMAIGRGMLVAIAIDEPVGTVCTDHYNIKDLREQFKARLKEKGIEIK